MVGNQELNASTARGSDGAHASDDHLYDEHPTRFGITQETLTVMAGSGLVLVLSVLALNFLE